MEITISEFTNSNNAFVAPGAKVYGNVCLEENASVWFNAVVRSEKNLTRIGKNSNVQDNSVVHSDPWTTVTIGESVTIGHGCIIHGCTIGDNTLVGMGSIIMNNAVIGKNCIIGAGTLITENVQIPDNSLVFGRPGKVIRSVNEEEIIRNTDNANHYSEIAIKYRDFLG